MKKKLLPGNSLELLAKLVLIMKLTIVIIFVAVFTVHAESYSQNTQLTFSLRKTSVANILTYIEENSEFYFFYKESELKPDRIISLNVKNENISQILDKILDGTNLSYTIVDRYIVITPREKENSRIGTSQQKVVKGIVTDNNGQPIPGVSITIKETAIGTVTDENGSYNIKVSNNAATLVFSFIGMKNKEIKISDGIFDVTLEPNVIGIDEVMVVAYGSAKRSSYTGSATVVDKDDLKKIQTSNVSQALQGMSSGVQVINNNGEPGADASIMIRGIGSMNASSAPLYVVDGVPFSGYLNSISSSDIESITVLKDASATSLYGSRAANGVIVITTKKGTSEKGNVHFKATLGYSDMAVDLPRKLTPAEYYEVTWQAMKNGQMDAGMTEENAAQWASDNVVNEIKINAFDSPDPVGLDGKIKTDVHQLFEGNWQDELIKSRARQEYLLDFSGKKENTQYYVSAGYLNDKGVFTTQKFERYSLRGNVSSKIKKWLEIGTNTGLSLGIQKAPDPSVWFIRTVPSIYPIYEWDYDQNKYKADDDGNKVYDYGDNRKEWIGWNPLADAAYNKTESLYDNVSSRSFLEITFLKGLKLRTNFSIDYNSLRYSYYANSTYGYAAGKGGEATKSSNRTFAYTFNNLLTFNHDFNFHHVNILIGQEAHKWRYNYLSASKEGFPFGGLYELRSAATMAAIDSYEDNYSLLSFLSRIEYDYHDKYYLTLSFRTDGSSRFHPDNRWGQFWSVGSSWRLSKEKFLSGKKWINNLKLKASYGAVGNDRISLYAYQGLYATGQDDYSYPGVLVSRLSTPDLKWESNLQLNLGVDYQIFNKVTGSIEWFNRKSKDLLFSLPLPPSTGFSGIDKNIGDIKNFGYEIQLAYTAIAKPKFAWNINLNLTHYRNKITRLPQKEINSGYFKWREGKSRYNFWGPEYAGVNPENGNDQWWKNVFATENGQVLLDENGKKIVTDRVKTEQYSDVSGDDQKKYLGDAIPDVFGSLTNAFKILDFDLSFMLYYSIGGKLYDGDYAQMMAYRSGMSYHEDVLKGWSPENPDSNIPRFSTAYQNSLGSYSSKFLYNNTFVRLRNISLGYNIPLRYFGGANINSVRLFIQGDNLLTFGKAQKRGTDPEQSISGTTNNRLTSMKTFTFGFEINL